MVGQLGEEVTVSRPTMVGRARQRDAIATWIMIQGLKVAHLIVSGCVIDL